MSNRNRFWRQGASAYNKPEKENTFEFGRWKIISAHKDGEHYMKHCDESSVFAKDDKLICGNCGAFTRDAAAFSMFKLMDCRNYNHNDDEPVWVDNPGSKQARAYLGYSTHAGDVEELATIFQAVSDEAVEEFKRKIRGKQDRKRNSRRYKRGRE